MNYKTKTIELLDLAQLEQRTWIASLSEAERVEVGTFVKWSAKDVFAHNIFWVEELALSFTDPDRESMSKAGEELDKANVAIFTQYHLKSWDEVNKFFERAYRSLLEQAKVFPLEVFSNTQLLPWQDGWPVWRLFISVGYMHPLTHLAQYDLGKGDFKNARNIQEKATEALLEVDPSPKWQGTILYNLGCFYAQIRDTYKAIEELRRSILLHPELRENSKTDPDLASLQNIPEYLALVDQYK